MATLALEVREREYSPSSVIGGNYGPFIEQYRALSARALGTMTVRRDLRYGAAERERLDYFPAPESVSSPALLVYIHGGYWQELSKDESAFLAPAWHRAGFAHAVVGYTLAPAVRLPEIVSQCRRALTWLVAHADRLRFDPHNIVVAGSSAGGYLAAACAAAPWPIADGHPPRLRGIIPVSGVFDVAPLIGTSINDALRLDESTAHTLDLLRGTHTFCPAVVAWGEVETSEFKRQSREFAAVVERSGSHCQMMEMPRRNHFDVVLDLGQVGSPLLAAGLALLDR